MTFPAMNLLTCLRDFQAACQSKPSDFSYVNQVKTIMRTILSIGSKDLDMDQQTKVELGEQLNLLIDPIKWYTLHVLSGNSYEVRSTLKSIQLLIQQYGSLPVGTSTLCDKLNERNIKEQIDLLQECVEDYEELDAYCASLGPEYTEAINDLKNGLWQ